MLGLLQEAHLILRKETIGRIARQLLVRRSGCKKSIGSPASNVPTGLGHRNRISLEEGVTELVEAWKNT